MNKNDVVKHVARRIDGCTQADVNTVLEVYGDFVKEVLSENPNETVMLPGLGKFAVKQVPERSGVSNLDGKEWTKPAKNVLKFNVAKAYKEL